MKTVLQTNIKELAEHHYLFYEDGEGNLITIDNAETVRVAAKAWKMSPAAVSAIKEGFDFLVENLVELLTKDLQDIWEEAKKK